MTRLVSSILCAAAVSVGCAAKRATGPAPRSAAETIPPADEIVGAIPDAGLAALRAEAEALRPMVTSRAALELLAAVPTLPPAAPTTVYSRPGGGYLSEAYTRAEHDALSEAEREGLRAMEIDTLRFYHTFYGSPLASVRAFDLAAGHGIDSFEGKRVLDFGFGSVGQLRLLAACGADAVGTEVMPLLRAIYAAPDAQGEVRGRVGRPGRRGRVTMVFGHWPAEAQVNDRVGEGFDLFISKNTLKHGYVNPPVPVEERRRLQFGVGQDVFLARLLGALKPGGLAVIYNIGGRPDVPDAPYDPSVDIACPWSRATLEQVGFDVLAYDEDDSETARRFGAALGWDEGEDAMDLEEGLFASYTVLRRPR